MFDHHLSLKGAYASIIYVNFNSKMQKKQYFCVHWQKKSTESLKNSTDGLRRQRVFPTITESGDDVN